MAHSMQKFQDGGFKNWLKGALAIIFCKEGLEDFVMDEMTLLQQDILQNIYTKHAILPNTICNLCTTANVLPCGTQSFCSAGRKCLVHDANVSSKTSKQCPNNICQRFSNAIVNTHRFTNPSWKNTDATLWCTNAFYVAKCYLPPDGYSEAASIKEIDFNGIISVLLTNRRFQNKMAVNLSNKTNTCTKLKVGSFVITTTDVTKILEDSSKALLSTTSGQIRDRHDEAMKSISEKERNIEDVIEKNTKDMNRRKAQLLEEIREEMVKLKQITRESIDEVIQAKEMQIKEMRQDFGKMAARLKQYGEEERQSLKETGDLERKSVMETSKQTIEHIEHFSSLKLAEVQEVAETVVSDIHDTKQKSVHHKSTEINDTDYFRLKSDLHKDLIEWYRDRYWTLPISPMVQENDAKLLEFYVNPTMYCSHTEHFNTSSDPRERTRVESYVDIFFTESSACKHIYVTAEPGSGKTSFVQKMALTWCQSQNQQDSEQIYFEKGDIETMKHFPFLFVIILRETNHIDCDVDDMIESQIFKNLSREPQYTFDLLVRVLHDEKCLIVLDGLDEWEHPLPPSIKCHCGSMLSNIPKNKTRRYTTFIKTSRPWKISQSRDSFSKVDKYIELALLDKESSDKLVSRVVSKLNKRYGKNKTAQDFLDKNRNTAIYLYHIKFVPVMLIQLICLWFDERTIGQNSCHVLSEMIDMLLSISISTSPTPVLPITGSNDDVSLIPNFLKKYKNFANQFGLLQNLGKLAYDTSFGQNNQPTTVFEKKHVQTYITELQLQYCFSLGLLTQTRQSIVSARAVIISFQHKLFQDYFSALYIASCNYTDVIDGVLRKCDTLEYFNAEIWPVLMFLSGFSSGAASRAMAAVKELLLEDTCSNTYRHTGISHEFDNEHIKIHPLKIMQDTAVSVLSISRETGNADVSCYIEDVFLIKGTYIDNHNWRCLQDIIHWNKDNIKSVCILDYDTHEEISSVIEMFGLVNLPSLVMLNVFGNVREDNLYQLLSGSVRTLKNFQYDGGRSLGTNETEARNISFCNEKLHVFESMKNLRVISLSHLLMLHEQIRQLLVVITRKTDMEYVGLYNINCKEHQGYACGDGLLDLSNHNQLTFLNLGYFPVQEIEFNSVHLEECRVSKLSDSTVLAAVFNTIEKAENLQTLYCHDIQISSGVNIMLSSLQKLTNLQHLVLEHCHIGDKELTLPHEMERFEYLIMYRISMSGSSLRQLVQRLERYPHYVKVRLRECKVLPEDDYNAIKMHIRTSEKWKVANDGLNDWKCEEFRFEKNI